MDIELKIDSKLCIICCHPFTADNHQKNGNKIIRFCAAISKNYKECVHVDTVNCEKNVIQLENYFGMSVCSSCLIVINELLTSTENMSFLENHVIFLQKQILQGLRDLDVCLEKVKYHQEKITESVKASDGLCLKNKFISQLGDDDDVDGKAEECKNFVFKVRQCIRKGGQNTEKRLHGSLKIPDLEEPELPNEQERILIKVEMQDEENDEHEVMDDFATSSQLSDDGGDDSFVLEDFEKKKLKSKRVRKFNCVTGKGKNSPRSKMTIKTANSVPILKNGKGYVCELCDGKVYRNRLSYKKHLNWHKGERNYKCEYCPKAFFRGDYLKDHIRTHTGERPFICDVCGKGFTQCVTMKKHKRNVHKR